MYVCLYVCTYVCMYVCMYDWRTCGHSPTGVVAGDCLAALAAFSMLSMRDFTDNLESWRLTPGNEQHRLKNNHLTLL
jgi:hypothetical protein